MVLSASDLIGLANPVLVYTPSSDGGWGLLRLLYKYVVLTVLVSVDKRSKASVSSDPKFRIPSSCRYSKSKI